VGRSPGNEDQKSTKETIDRVMGFQQLPQASYQATGEGGCWGWADQPGRRSRKRDFLAVPGQTHSGGPKEKGKKKKGVSGDARAALRVRVGGGGGRQSEGK